MVADGAGEVIFDWFVDLFGESLPKIAAREKLDRFGPVSDWLVGQEVGFLPDSASPALRTGGLDEIMQKSSFPPAEFSARNNIRPQTP